jgi:hypothetical protein
MATRRLPFVCRWWVYPATKPLIVSIVVAELSTGQLRKASGEYARLSSPINAQVGGWICAVVENTRRAGRMRTARK